MYRMTFFLALIATFSMAACSVASNTEASQQKPNVDKLLKDLNLPTDFWQKSIVKYYKTKDGWNTWFIGADEAPKRLEDGECASKNFTWIVAVNPKTGQGIPYSEDDSGHNPDISFIVNDDTSKHSIACDQIDRNDYFLLDDGIQPHQAVLLVRELQNAAECAKQGQITCGRWKKLELNVYKDDFLRLPTLHVFAVDYEDRDTRDKIRIQYMLSPVSPDRRPYLHVLDCFVRELPDGSLELDVAEGDYE